MNPAFICQLTNLHLIAISGEKAASFLQGQVTCDIREINASYTRRGAHCTPKGRVLSSFRVVQFNSHWYLLAPNTMSQLIIQQLKKYAIFSKTALALDETIQVMGFSSASLAKQLTALVGQLPQEPDQCLSYTTANGENLLLIRVQGTVPRFEILGTTSCLNWLRHHLPTDIEERSNAAWHLLDIEAGVAAVYPPTSDLFTPQMLNYPAIGAVSLKKGCYTGQEIIARTHYLGKAKRHLHTLSLHSTDLPKPGDELHNHNQQSVGVIVEAAAFSQAAECVLLAVIHDDAAAEKLYWQHHVCYI